MVRFVFSTCLTICLVVDQHFCLTGAEQVYVHVHRNNIAAQELYEKLGFKMVELATPQLSRDKMYLLCYIP